MAELQGKFTTVAYDARGWGQSDKNPAGYKLADLADEALALIEKLGIKTYVLVGHSLGGKISQLIASRNPQGLKGLVLVAPAPPTPLRFPDEMRETQIHAYDSPENVLQTISFLSARTPSPDIVEQIVEDSMSGSREATLAYPMASILEDISSEVSKISVPTLVLAGELDKLDSIEQHEREVVARIPNARFGNHTGQRPPGPHRRARSTCECDRTVRRGAYAAPLGRPCRLIMADAPNDERLSGIGFRIPAGDARCREPRTWSFRFCSKRWPAGYS